MPLSQWQITSLGLAILIPTVLIALADTPPDPGAEPVARTLIALHKRRR